MIRSSVCKVILYAHLESNSSVAAGGGVRIIFGSIAACVRTYVYTYINLAYTITQYYYLYLFNNIMSYNLHIHLNILIHNYQYLRLYLTLLQHLQWMNSHSIICTIIGLIVGSINKTYDDINNTYFYLLTGHPF